MPGVKKLVVVLSVLATGVSTAFFFRKDASQFDFRQEASSEDPFRERIERRVTADATWNSKLPAARAGSATRRAQQVSPATAAIPQGLTAESQPTFQKSFNPVGALLEPLEGVPPDERDATEGDFGPLAAPDAARASSALAHEIVDGDTLSKLALEYLGAAERFLEIYQLNRDVLASPDLLPIGRVLKIPPRQAPGAAGPRHVSPPWPEAPPPLDLVPVPQAGPNAPS